MDWNWFFSALAQSVAALVGVLGAFLISRMLNSEAEHARSRRRTRELLRASERLADQADSRFIHWYNEQTLRDYVKGVLSDVRDGKGAPRAPEEYLESYFVSPYVPRADVLDKTQRAIDRGLEQRSSTTHYLEPLFDAPVVGVDAEGEAIAQLVVAIKAHLREVREHLEAVDGDPERSAIVRGVLLALLLLFWAGVVYPLGFLPVALGDAAAAAATGPDFSGVRVMLLAVAASVFSGLVITLGIRNERLTHPEEELRELRSWLEAGSYSSHLKVYVENGNEL